MPPGELTLTGRCPLCQSALLVREARREKKRFIGCDGYPRCAFTAPYDEALQALAAGLALWQSRCFELLNKLATAQAQTPLSLEALDRALRDLAIVAHPDRWQGSAVATELTKQVNALRTRVKQGKPL